MRRKPHATPSAEEPDRGPLLGALLRRSHQVVLGEIARGLRKAGHTEFQSAHNGVMRPLWDRPEGMRATEIAAAARITKQSIGAIVDQLEQHGYVERVDDPADQRAKLVRLTKRGRDAGRITRSIVRTVEADWARRIGAARLAALRETLTDLLASLEMDA